MKWAATLLVAISALVPAQERLTTTRTLAGGAALESIRFGESGVVQTTFAGVDSVRVTSVRQFTLPISAAVALGESWRVDITTLYASGAVRYTPVGEGNEHEARLDGISDVRVRATGSVLGPAFTLTLGANFPTGRTTLSQAEFATLRVVAAPVLAMGSPPVGSGPSGTVGAVVSQAAGAWTLAYGASFEERGRYQPVAALVAGAPSADFRPGGVVRASVGADRIIGQNRLSMAAALDWFAKDRLRGTAADAPAGTPISTLATVQLGPVFTSDVQLTLATRRLKDLIGFASFLWRAAYARDGRTAEGTSGRQLSAGLRAAMPLRAGTDVVLAGEGRWHSGLAVDQGLPTAGVRSASVTGGLDSRLGAFSLQPFVRLQAGSLWQRSTEGSNRPFTGISGGIVLVTRF